MKAQRVKATAVTSIKADTILEAAYLRRGGRVAEVEPLWQRERGNAERELPGEIPSGFCEGAQSTL